MADFNSSLPIRTENAGDAIVKVADATTPSQQLKVESDGSINVNAAFSPGTEVIITDGTDDLAVNADGSLNAVVSATNLDIRDLSAAQDSVAISDGTDSLAINADGSINITDNGGSITVDGSVTVSATDLDIRDLTSVSDSVSVLQATHDNLNLNANLQVNNTDVANGNPVPISDAGGSITVDGAVTVSATDLDIRNLAASQDNVAISDGTDTLAVNADGSINSVVTATNLDIRDLSASTDSVAANIRDEAGNSFSNTNPLPVSVVDVEGTEVNDYNTAASIAGGATSNHDYAASGAFKLRTIFASASSKLKVEVQIETGAATGVFNTVFVGFNSTATPNIEIPIKDAISVLSGARVRVIRTNRDNQSQDVYSTISGFLV